MNLEIKQKWLEALRSGKYEQGRRVLRSADDKYCCLGVLCDLIDPNAWTPGGSYFESIGVCAVKHRGFYESMPGGGIREEAGLGPYESEKLAEMNDAGESFETIAKYIEENL
jgi:hypothetical protein